MVVVRRRAWPSRSATVFIGTSRRTIWDARVCRNTWAPRRGTVTPARRSARLATSVTFPPMSCRYGGRAVAKIRSGGLVGGPASAARRPRPPRRRRAVAAVAPRPPLPATRTVPLCQSMSFTARAATSPCPQAKPDQQQQDGAVTKPARARHVHRGQHPLDVFGGDGAGQRGVRPLADGRHGAVDAGRNHTAGGGGSAKTPGWR